MTNIYVLLAQRLQFCVQLSTTINQSLLDEKHNEGGRINKVPGIVVIADNEKITKDYYTEVMSKELKNQLSKIPTGAKWNNLSSKRCENYNTLKPLKYSLIPVHKDIL